MKLNRILRTTRRTGARSETTEANERLKLWLAFVLLIAHAVPAILRSL